VGFLGKKNRKQIMYSSDSSGIIFFCKIRLEDMILEITIDQEPIQQHFQRHDIISKVIQIIIITILVVQIKVTFFVC
jgi:hypothetical protein